MLLLVTQPCAARGMATPKLKIVVRLNEPHSPCGDVRRRITEASPGAAGACSALTHPNTLNRKSRISGHMTGLG